MRVVTDVRVVRFIENRLKTTFIPPFTAMGVELDGAIVGGIVFNMFEGADCHMTVASDRRPWPKGFLADVGEYLFDQLKRERVTVMTEQPRVVSIARRLGGQVEGVLRHHYGHGRDATVVGILRDEWKYRRRGHELS